MNQNQISNCLASARLAPRCGLAIGRVIQLDEALIEQQRQAYKVEGVDEDEDVDVKEQRKQLRKRKAATDGDEVGLLLLF